jgi:hypothetical protein
VGDLKFVPQSMLDVWTDLGKIELQGTTLRIPLENVAFALTPAVRFISLLEGEDAHKLLQKVKTEAYVREIGGEVVTDSCLVGETAYQVQPGFLAEGEALQAAQGAKATKKLAPKAAVAAEKTPAPLIEVTPPVRPAGPPIAVRPPSPLMRVPEPVASKPGQPPTKDEADLLTQFLVESLK